MLDVASRAMLGYAQGRRPYVNFLGATYSNEELAQRHELVGQQI